MKKSEKQETIHFGLLELQTSGVLILIRYLTPSGTDWASSGTHVVPEERVNLFIRVLKANIRKHYPDIKFEFSDALKKFYYEEE